MEANAQARIICALTRLYDKRNMEEINEKEERAARDVLAAYGTPDEEVTASDTTAPNPVAASDGDLCLSDPIEVGASDAPKEPLADLRIAEDSTADEIREAIDRHTEAICQTMSDEEAAKLGEKVLADLGYGEERNKLLEEKKAEEEA